MPNHDEELLERFNTRLAAIEDEVPSPPETSVRGAGSTADLGRKRSALPGWIGATLVAAVLVGLAVIGLRLLGLPGPTPSPPAVGHTVAPSSSAQASSSVESPTPTSGASVEPSHRPGTTPTIGPSLTPLPTPTTFPTVPAETPPAGPSGWTGPERIAKEHYDDVSLVVDAAGHAHVAAAKLRDGIFYLTNASGPWTRVRLTTASPEGYDGELSTVIRGDGALAIAFTRFAGLQCSFGCSPVDPQGIFLVSDLSGSWPEATQIIDGTVQEPSLQQTYTGLHLAYTRGGNRGQTVEYAHAADGVDSWTIETVGEGRSPSLRIGSDGLARIAFGDALNLYYAVRADSGEFAVETVPGDWSVYTGPFLSLNATDEPQIVFFNQGDGDVVDVLGDCGALSMRRTAGTWSDATVVFPEDEFCQLDVADIATDSGGTLHVMSDYNLTDKGVWYANDAGTEFQAKQLRDLGDTSVSDVTDGDSGIAADSAGRPHVLYVVLESRRGDDDGLWYGIGPAE